ncbi:hypothetical protein TIFTF001_000053 [Ficus carica]|uniref:Uncharacterized protein n=1 Tax=Ficus carica TaxID=3494 RepID=A0AA87Z0K9_FICCA|nr:hypothetical protein TIFTF001_000053 [Ficus carica]
MLGEGRLQWCVGWLRLEVALGARGGGVIVVGLRRGAASGTRRDTEEGGGVSSTAMLLSVILFQVGWLLMLGLLEK